MAKFLARERHGVEALGLSDVEEPLLYDLYTVDEHLVGLGGGHFRVYSKSHETGKWYHFDDTHISPSQETGAVMSIDFPT